MRLFSSHARWMIASRAAITSSIVFTAMLRMVTDAVKHQQVLMTGLRLHRHAFSRVGYRLISTRGSFDSGAMHLADENDIKRPGLQHSRILALTFVDGECLRGVVPVNWNGGVDPILVVVAIVLVFVEGKRAIGSAIDPQLHRVGRLLGRVLQVRSHGNNRSGANIKWNLVQWSGCFDHCPAGLFLTGPEVVPGPLRQVRAARLRARFGDWAHQ